MYFVVAFAITRVMRLVERRAKASVGRAPERGRGGPGRVPPGTAALGGETS